MPPRVRASATSCVITTTAAPPAACPFRSPATSSRRSASSPLVGSSAIRMPAPPASVAASATRCAMPPDSLKGSRRSAPARPSLCSAARASERDSLQGRPRTRAWTSATCSSAGIRGSRADQGSCGSRLMDRPQSARRSSGARPAISLPSSAMRPRQESPFGSVPITACMSSDLPEPLSPRMTSIPPDSTAKEAPSTSFLGPAKTSRSSTRSALIADPVPLRDGARGR